MRSQTIAQGFAAVLLSLALAACGGGGPSIGNGSSGSSSSSSSSSGSSSSSSSGSSGSSSGTTSSATSITVVTSSSQLSSSASTSATGVTITAIVKDANNNLLSGVPVSFAATAGGILATVPTTDSTGTATAILTTGGDPTTQTITITASAGGASGTISNSVSVFEVGTTVGVSGSSVIGLGATQNYTVTVRDASNAIIANTPVAFTSSNGNSISPSSATKTNGSGQVTFAVTGSKTGADTLTATALGNSVATPVTVSVNELSFSSPASGMVVKFNAVQSLAVLLQDSSGAAQAGKVITFTTDRGTLTSSGGSGTSVTATTGANGVANVNFQSDGSQGAGGVTVSASAPDGTTVQLALQLVAVTPAAISIQAHPTTIAASSTATIQALVIDAKNNPVPGVTVDFVLSADSSGGGLSAGSAVTNNQGQAIVTYNAGPSSSGTNGVQINASVHNTAISTAPSNPATLTVASNPLFIKLGTGVQITDYPPDSSTPTEYQQQFSVIVQDSAGHPAPANTVVVFQLQSTSFQTGSWQVTTGSNGNIWAPVYNIAVDGSDANAPAGTFGCVNEDTNHDGILDAGDDNYMVNTQSNQLFPGNVATVTAQVTLDATGSGQILVTWPKDYSEWVQVQLTAATSVAGTQYSADRTYVLPVATKDVNHPPDAPPGVNFGTSIGSPYGLWTKCQNVAGSTKGPGIPGFPGS